MALFESYERRIKQIDAVLNNYGIASIEEAEKITKDAGLDVYNQIKGIQPICFENACWAYTVGAAIAIKKGCRKAADAAAAIGEGLQAFCIPGSVADTRKVGLGVPFFKMAALMTGGDFSICSQVGKGTEVKAVFGLTHIDRMPLGNMADTMCILMGCNEQINFSFTYQVGEEIFSVSTAQLQEILDGVPLNSPQVMEFIREYIKENMDLLSGGAS